MQSRAVLDHPKAIKKGQKKSRLPIMPFKKTSRLPIMPFLQDSKKQLEIPIEKERTGPTKIDV